MTRPYALSRAPSLAIASSLLAVLLSSCTPASPGGNGNGSNDQPIELPTDGTVTLIAGTGVAGFSGDGGPSIEAQLDRPMDVVVTADGLVLIADFNNHRVRQVDLNTGRISTVAGDGSTSGAEALYQPTDLTLRISGNFIVAAWGANQVFEYPLEGSRMLLAGDGTNECVANPGEAPADELPLLTPRSTALLADGSILISEQACHRVMRVRTDGTVDFYAGTGQAGYSGDDGDADEAQIHGGDIIDGPSLGIALSPEDPPDELFIADTLNHVVRVVKPFSGTIDTFAGTGDAGYLDGGPDEAMFDHPTHVYSPSDHSLWVSDSGNHAIRYVDPLRLSVSTAIGTGQPGNNGEGLQADESQLNNPGGVFVTRNGDVFIADTDNHRVLHFFRF